MSNQDIDGKLPPDAAPGGPPKLAGANAGAPQALEQELAKEREAKALMRDRLRHTEALAAESHALRARMAQELEKVTADRDRLRHEAANAATAAAHTTPIAPPATMAAKPASGRTDPPLMTPRATDWPPRTDPLPRRSGPWRALALLGGVAAAVACVAWFTGTWPGHGLLTASSENVVASAPAADAPVHATAPSAPEAVATAAPTPAANGLGPSPGATALPPLSPEAQLAAAPSAAGPSTAAPVAPSPAATPVDKAPAAIAARVRTALDSEGIAAPVEVDAATGRVSVSDPQADAAARDRTDLVIRAVYAGASLPEPQIEHRWVSPKRGERPAPVAAAAPAPAPATLTPAQAYAARHAASAARHHKDKDKAGATTVADAEELRPVLPAGRVTVACMDSLAGKSGARRAGMTSCMKQSCCSTSANKQSEECRAYERAYPFTCGAG